MTKGRNFLQASGAQLKLAASAVAEMLSHVQIQSDFPEAGGLLLGRHLQSGEHVSVDLVTTPMSGDRASRFSFFRSMRGHQARLDREWAASGRKTTYLGEWHTHPEEVPTPSLIDLKDWRDHLERDTYEGNRLFFIIVGTRQLRVWEGQRGNQMLVPLEEILPANLVDRRGL